jgi:regulator of protease activity HflC (stomatin/prohibitin superfamily)
MYKIVMDWQRTLLYRDGKLGKVLEPGRHHYDQKRCTLVDVDMRPRQMQVTGQELLTRDGLSLRVSLTADWVVTDPVAFTTGAQHTESVLYAAVQDAARARVAAHGLDELIADRSLLSGAGEVAAAVETNGIRVASVRARDLMLPGELRKAALETVLARERGRADLERARAEAAALRSLANTARLLEENPALLRLRTLQVAGAPGTQIVLDPRERP